jgi:DNA-binding beta-propeller fold protein YncE
VTKRGWRAPLAVGLIALLGATGLAVTWSAGPDPVVRTIPIGPRITSAAVDEQVGRVFVGASDASDSGGRLSVFDTMTGALIRPTRLPDIPGDIVVDARAGHAFVSAVSSGVISMLDARNGKAVRTFSVGPYPSEMALDQRAGRLYVATPNFSACPRYATSAPCNTVDVFDTSSGHLARAFTIQGRVGTMAVDGRANRLIVAGDDGLNRGTLNVFDATSGQILSSTRIGLQLGFPTGRAVAVDETAGRAFVLSSNFPTSASGDLYVLDSHSGALLSTRALNALPTGVSVDSGAGLAFVTTLGPVKRASGGGGLVPAGAGSVSILDARRGAIERTITTGVAAFGVTSDTHSGHVLVTNVGTLYGDGSGTFDGAGSVTILDGRTGRVLHTVASGVFPAQIVVDARRGRAFVVNNGGPVRAHDAWAWVPSWLRRALPFLPRASESTRQAPSSITVLDTTR